MVYEDALKVMNDLAENVRIKDGAGLTLEVLEKAIKNELKDYGLPVMITHDQVQSGGFFNRKYENCLCIVNTQHESDYFKYCIRLSKTGNVAFIRTHYFGESKLTYKKNVEEERRNSGSLARMALGAIFKADSQALDAEYQYYDIVNSALCEVYGV